MIPPQLEKAKEVVRAAARAAGITAEQLVILSPAIAKYVATAVLYDRAQRAEREGRESWRRDARAWLESAQARVEEMHRGGAHGSR